MNREAKKYCCIAANGFWAGVEFTMAVGTVVTGYQVPIWLFLGVLISYVLTAIYTTLVFGFVPRTTVDAGDMFFETGALKPKEDA